MNQEEIDQFITSPEHLLFCLRMLLRNDGKFNIEEMYMNVLGKFNIESQNNVDEDGSETLIAKFKVNDEDVYIKQIGTASSYDGTNVYEFVQVFPKTVQQTIFTTSYE